MNINESSVQNVAQHSKHAFENLLDWFALKAIAKKQNATKLTMQWAFAKFFGGLVAIWAEVTLFLFLKTVIPSHFAALALLSVNALIFALLNKHFNMNARPLAEIESEQKKTEATVEWAAAKSELTAIANHLVQDRVVIPFNRYKIPAAAIGTFVAGVVIGNAVGGAGRHDDIDAPTDEDLKSLI